MDNPFLKRVTERLRDEEAFLDIVSPEPLKTFLGEYGRTGQLYEPLVIVRGAPGSGKTTLSRLFHFPTITTLLRNRNLSAYKPLLAALTECGVVRDELPTLLSVRLPMESNYRDTWEFPYSEELRTSLLTALIQARSVLGWLRNLRTAGVEDVDVEIIPREDAVAAVESIGGISGVGLGARAREVELALYGIAGSLVAPDISTLPAAATGAYKPLDVIEKIRVRLDLDGVPRTLDLRPLLILDDAHALHPQQFVGIKRWLARRELRIARWMLTRLDILTPAEVLQPKVDERGSGAEQPGIIATRDTLLIFLQSNSKDRREQRTAFRVMARDMASRYLRRMPVFLTKGLGRLEDLLSTEEPTLPSGKLRELSDQVDLTQRKLSIPNTRRVLLEAEIGRYEESTRSTRITPDIRLAMLGILMHRYANRVPQATLFGSKGDPDPGKPVIAKKGVVEGARLHLLHRFERPFYYGMEALADASSENAEQFLQLAYQLVDSAETQLTRNRPAMLDAVTQHRQLRQRAIQLLEQWSFPYHEVVRHLTDELASQCIAMSLRPNAQLGPGANAYGIPADDFARIPKDFPALARILQFGVAYNALTLVPDYPCQDERWYLLELGGLIVLKSGLTLQRGGFIEGTTEDLARLVG